jgi:hypothetical protein
LKIRRSSFVAACFVAFVSLLGSWAYAQERGTIAGVVKDSTDAVLPGVTVEAASPALIEKVRSTTTDASGQYRIIDLPPGVYRVTFTLTGFASQARDNVEVRVNFTTPINGTLTVGQQAETITVTGASPIVDVQSVTQSRAITADQNREIPSGSGVIQLATLVPGVTANFTDVGGSSAESAGTRVTIRGGSNGDTMPLLDGLKVGNLFVGAGQVNIMPLNPLLADEIDVQTAGQGAESSGLGVTTNMIPKSGGNSYSGVAYFNGGRGAWQASNLTDRIKALGLTQVNSVKHIYDFNGAFGGPIARDRLWFYATARDNSYANLIAGQYFTQDISATKRVLDLSRPAYNETDNKEATFRVAAAITAKQRLTGLIYYQRRLYPYQNISSTVAPESATNYDFPGWFYSGSYNNVLSNKLLFEAAMLYSYSPFRWTPDSGVLQRNGGLTAQQIIAGVGGAVVPIVEQGGTTTPPWTFRASTIIQYKGETLLTRLPYRGSLSYNTGSHSVKFGFDQSSGVRRNDTTYDPIGNISYRTLDFVPNQLTLYAPPGVNAQMLDVDLGLYAQDRWTKSRATITLGLRADMLKASTADFVNGANPWIPGRGGRAIDSYKGITNVPNWKDLNPRLGVAYDLFGNGKTALKASAVRSVYQEALGTAIANDPATTVAASTTRNWNDGNKNFIPDCDLTNPAANGECGANLNAAFGSSVPATTENPNLLNGWHKRPWIWEFSGGVQQQLLPRVSVNVSWFRRVEGNFQVIDNLATTAADYRSYTMTVPNDPRIPNAGSAVTLYDVKPALASAVNNYITFASDYGNESRHYTGYDVTIDARPGAGVYLQGGLSTGNIVSDSCDIVKALPETMLTALTPSYLASPAAYGPTNVWTPLEYCHQQTGYTPQYKFLGSYTLPWWDLRVSGTLQSNMGPQINANVIYTGAQIVAQNPSLGAFSTGNNGNVTAFVMTPGTLFNDRTNQIDLRFAKIVKFRGRGGRAEASIDLYNIFNSDAIQGQNNTYSGVNGGAWLRPTGIIPPRFIKFNVRWDF